MSQKPSVGRIVHYTSYGTPGGEYPSVCRAAVVTSVHENSAGTLAQAEIEHWDYVPTYVDLCVMNPEGLFFNHRVDQNETTRKGGTWHWPERVD
jgi:hypothetical protein